MDNAAFQGMPRFPLTPAEEALVPRPHASASQVATALPSTYTRHGSSPPQSPLHRPQYARKLHQNNPYSANQGLRVLPFSFSSSSLTNRNQSPPSSPTTPSNNNTAFGSNETVEQEYPQNPQDSYHNYHPQLHSPTPIRSSSPEPPPRKSFSLSPRPARPPSPQLYSDLYENTSYQRQYSVPFPPNRSSLDSNIRQGSPLQQPQTHQESWGNSVRVESPEPMSDSDSSRSDNNETQHSSEPRRFSGKAILRRLQGSQVALSTTQESGNDTTSQHRTSLESEHTNRFSYESQREVLAKPIRSGTIPQDISDEERQEPRKSRSGWRPSLSLIRQEGSTFNVLNMQDQRRYPQNDQRRFSEKPRSKDHAKNKTNDRPRKRKRVPRKDRTGRLQPESHSKGRRSLPTLAEVLEKKTRYPLGYDDFEAFLRSQRAVEYLNFWADVTAHEQLCRTFSISERRLKREYQLEERALARDRRRLTRPVELEAAHSSQDHEGPTQEPWVLNNRIRTTEQEISSSNLYLTSRSSLQLPIHDHLSFPQEPRRYGIQDSSIQTSPSPLSLKQRRGSEQRATDAYNRILAGSNARKSSLDRSRQSLDRIPLEHDTDINDTQERPSVEGLRIQGKKSPTSSDSLSNGIHPSISQQSVPMQGNEQAVRSEIAQLVEAVEELIPPGRMDQYINSSSMLRASQQSLRIIEPTLRKKPSGIRSDSTNGRPLSPISGRRSGESAFPPSPYSTVHDGRPLLVQSYRTISLEDLEESALRIYRKYLIQLRTLSMAREEEAAIAAANTSAISTPHSTAIPIDVTASVSGEQILAPGWEGYAGQVIAEWNKKWRGRNADERRAKRLSERKIKASELGKEAIQSTANTASASTTGESLNEKIEPSESEDFAGEGGDPDHSSNDGSTSAQRPKMDRKTTATGITSFLARLLRTETTVLELPTLTINTTTVVTDADESIASEYDDEDDYCSDEIDGDEDDESTEANNQRLEAPKMTFGANSELSSTAHTVASSVNGDPLNSEVGTDIPIIQLQHLNSMQRDDEASKTVVQNPRNPDLVVAMNATSEAISATLPPASSLESIAQSAAAAAFYLPLECRQRIHTQIQQEKRTYGAHVFGPAKGFVVEVVLREHYYPLFLRRVRKQNMGFMSRGHVRNRIKQRGVLLVGIALWTVVIAIQVMLVIMAWGGWARPWVWVVGIIGGWPGSTCIAASITGFSPILGLLGKIAEDRHVFRFRGIIEGSVLKRHRQRAFWILFYCLSISLMVSVIFAALPQQYLNK